MGSMSGLYVGVSGLTASQAALNATSHNLTNTDTKGYVRQQVVLTDTRYINWGENAISTYQKGTGTNVATVKQVRDVFLDKSYRQEYGREGYYQTQYATVQEIEDMFGELEGVAFQDTIEDMWTSIQELAKEPSSIVARASLIQTAVTFMERAENISTQLNNYQVNLNTQINNYVKEINDIGDQIHELNTKIRHYESNGVEKANDLRDKRNALLDELSGLVSITYTENMDGVVTANVEGVPFVTEDMSYKMGTVKMGEDTDMIKPVWIAHGDAAVFNLDNKPSSEDDTDIGSLKGLITSRGYKQANYTDIPIRENYETDQEYKDAISTYNQYIDSSVIMTVQSQFDQLIHGITTTINNILAPNKEVTLTDGTVIKVLDEEKAPVGMDKDMTMGEGLFNRKSVKRYSEPEDVQIVNEDGTVETVTVRIYNEEDKTDNYSLFTLGEIEINKEILNNYSKIPLSSNTGSGEYDIETCEELLKQWQSAFATLSPNTLTINNFNEYYTSMIAEMANRGEQLKTISTSQETMVTSIDNQRMGVTGVSSDEELTNLIKYQHAYNAAARYVNVVSEMLQDVIVNFG